MLTVKTFTFNPLQENTMVVYNESRQAVIVDPGCYENDEQAELDNFIRDEGLAVTTLLNTHCHFDHVLGNDHVKQKYNVPLLIGSNEVQVLAAIPSYISNYGFARYQQTTPDKLLEEGDHISVGAAALKVLFLPGHSPGHIGFYSVDDNFLLSGDVLFNRSIGRTDLPGGSFQTLMDSINKKLFVLPDDTVVYPGHGPITTLGDEKKFNPFCGLSSRMK